MALISEHLWAQMSAAEQQLVTETVQGLRRKGREIACPHCAKVIRLITTFQVVAKDDDDAPPMVKALPAAARPSSVEQRLLEAARASGLLDVFAATVTAEKDHSGVPVDIAAFFLQFWELAAPIQVSAVVLASWIEEFGGRIHAMQANGIVAVFSDHRLVAFVPNRLTQPARVKAGRRATISNAASLELWTKGRFGYVPAGASDFGEALAQRNLGAFGALTQ